ncbi:MAG: hypothetical protein GY865_09540 [candidate division Zixibacteria bacterium]|nr:hypothetical protein [candidate division Zixibacteria bacterium]
MIPSALTNRGPYATIWGHIKSIDNALGRALDEKGQDTLTDLDRNRIEELIVFLKDAILTESTGTDVKPESLFSMDAGRSEFSSAIDLRQKLNTIKIFQEWHKPSKRALDASIERLTNAAAGYLKSSEGVLFPKNVPRKEFSIMKSIITALLIDAETDLQG